MGVINKRKFKEITKSLSILFWIVSIILTPIFYLTIILNNSDIKEDLIGFLINIVLSLIIVATHIRILVSIDDFKYCEKCKSKNNKDLGKWLSK